MTEVNFLTDEFFTQFGYEHQLVVTKEKHIAALREELKPEQPKLLRTALLAVVAKKLGLDAEKFKGRKAVARQFRDSVEACDIKPALAKILCENAIKFSRHEAFREEVSQGVHEGVEWYTQIIASVLDAEEITTQSKLIAFLNPKEELPDEVQIALLALKLAGVKAKIKKGKIEIDSADEVEKAQKIASKAVKLLDGLNGVGE